MFPLTGSRQVAHVKASRLSHVVYSGVMPGVVSMLRVYESQATVPPCLCPLAFRQFIAPRRFLAPNFSPHVRLFPHFDECVSPPVLLWTNGLPPTLVPPAPRPSVASHCSLVWRRTLSPPCSPGRCFVPPCSRQAFVLSHILPRLTGLLREVFSGSLLNFVLITFNL